jgi:hypothetical protein
MFCEQAEADEQVSFAATHRLLQMEHGRRGNRREPRNALADEFLHTLRDEGFFKKGGAVAFGVNQFVELLDLVP